MEVKERNKELASTMQELQKEFDLLVQLDRAMAEKSNAERRNIYARAQLLIMDFEDSSKSDNVSPEVQEKKDTLENISKNCKLVMIRQKRSGFLKFWDNITGAIRTFAVVLFLILSGVVVALPCVMLRPLEYYLLKWGVISPYNRLAVYSKHFISISILLLAGVEVITEGLQKDKFGKDCVILCFSHSSTLDAFIIGQTVPVFHRSLGKAELFLIPFFSLLLLAFGGLPINRKDRDQAVNALSGAASMAYVGDCVCVSPEGTRSLTGHILPFKKGPFYMWEQLKTPVIPMVFVGAYDLYPPGKNIPFSGKVYTKFLQPIAATEVTTREEMSRLLRRKMLQAWKEPSEDAAKPVSWSFFIKHILSLIAFYGTCYYAPIILHFREILAYYGISALQGVGLYLVASIAITLIFYVYLMYIDKFIMKLSHTLFGGRNKTK